MSLTINDIIKLSDTYVCDRTYLNISSEEKINAVSEACVWLLEKTLTDHALRTAFIEYTHGINRYKISATIPDILDGADLKRPGDLQLIPAKKKSVREMYEDIASNSTEFAYAIERGIDGTYILINLDNDYNTTSILSLSSLNSDNATITATGGAINLQSNVSKLNNSIRFDTTTSVGDTYSGIKAVLQSNIDISNYDLNGVIVLSTYLQDVTGITSISLKLHSSVGDIILATTTNASDEPLVKGENTILFRLSDTSDSYNILKDISEIHISINQPSGTIGTKGFILKDLRITNPEDLKLSYISQYIGTTSGGTKLTSFNDITNIPFFSGTYDNYKYAVARKMSSIIFRELRLNNESNDELKLANDSLVDKQKLFPSSVPKEDRGFKVKGINFNKSKY